MKRGVIQHCMMKSFITLVLILFLSSAFLVDDVFADPPENICVNISYVNKDRFTVSWVTSTSKSSKIYYSTAEPLTNEAFDVRGELYVGTTHYVTVSGLEADTTYLFDIECGGNIYDNGTRHYSVTTGPVLPPAVGSDIVYGQVFLNGGTTPAEGAIVHIRLQDNDASGTSGDSQICTVIVDSNGYWFIDLKNVRTQALDGSFDYSASGDNLILEVKCPNGETKTVTVDTANDSPAANIVTAANTVPVLDWEGGAGYSIDGLEPETGNGTTDFVFKITYSDANGDRPLGHKVYIDRNGDNDYFDEDEACDMTELSGDYNTGMLYVYTTNIPYSATSQNCSYFFRFSDGIAFATGNITEAISEPTAINKPDVFQGLSLSLSPSDWSLTNILVGSEHITDNGNKITVTNDGDGVQTYSMAITDEGGWTAATTKDGTDIDIFVLSALFTETSLGAVDSSYFSETANDDLILTTNNKSTASRFGSTRTSENGTSVPDGEERSLWLEFKAPTKDTTGGAQKSIDVTVTAETP